MDKFENVPRWEFYLGGGKTQEPDGKYVTWEDYAELLMQYRTLKYVNENAR